MEWWYTITSCTQTVGWIVDRSLTTMQTPPPLSLPDWLYCQTTSGLRQDSRLRTRDGRRGQTEQNREQNKMATTNVTWQTVHSKAWAVNQWSFITFNNYILWLVNDLHNGKITPMMWSSNNFELHLDSLFYRVPHFAELRSSTDFCLKI